MKIIALCVVLMGVYALSAQQSLVPVIHITPNPMEKNTTITVQLQNRTDLGINIETQDGIVVKTLFWGQSDKDVVLVWNRVCDDGSVAPNGTYDVVVNYAGRYTSTKKTLILK